MCESSDESRKMMMMIDLGPGNLRLFAYLDLSTMSQSAGRSDLMKTCEREWFPLFTKETSRPVFNWSKDSAALRNSICVIFRIYVGVAYRLNRRRVTTGPGQSSKEFLISSSVVALLSLLDQN